MELTKLTIAETSKKLKNKDISVIELVKSYMQKIEKLNETINAYITICNEGVEEHSKALQKKLDSGDDLPVLFGIPMALNDNIITRNILTTCASKMLRNFIPPYDSAVNKKLCDEGAILLGKLNMDEFAIGNSNENSYFGLVKNPQNFERVPGGSSGGAASAVASGMARFALGSDTGGGIRQPASFCGVVGLKPTYGLVSRYGLVASASSMDQIGPITRNVEDCATVLNAITGYDPKDSTSANIKYPDYTSFLIDDIKGMKIGIHRDYIEKDTNSQVKQKILDACSILESLGAEIVEVSLPTTEYAIAAHYIISSAETSSNLARYDGIRYGYRAENYEGLESLYSQTRGQGFGTEAKRRILLGTYVLSSGHYDEYYKKALKARQLIINDYKKAFEYVDVIVSPTTPETAFKIGEKQDGLYNLYSSNAYTVSASLAGLCAMSIPIGKDSEGLPIGMQLIGKHYGEGTLIKVANKFEEYMQF